MMSSSAVTPSPSPVPSIAVYNIRFLSLSDSSEQRAQHQRKLANVQHLAKQYIMTAILETHVTGAKAELFFCRFVEGTRRFFVHGMTVLVQEAWADHLNPTLETVVDGVIIALVWECGSPRHFAFFFRLGEHAEATRIHQFDKLLDGPKSMFAQKTLWSSLEIGILFALILKGGVVRRQRGDRPCA